MAADFDAQVFDYIRQHDGCTAVEVAEALPVEDVRYGTQKAVSWSVARLRKAGWIADCPRCLTCGCATSRGQKNVPLTLTPSGWIHAMEVGRAGSVASV